MTPEEKAKELIFMFEQYKLVNHDLAKLFASLVADEIIKEPSYGNCGRTYWQQVKQEISNL